MTESKRERIRFATKNPVGVIDREAGIIFGISILTIGRAAGHGLYIDKVMLDQSVAFGKEKEPIGLKCRFDHPGACGGSMGTFVGRFHKFRRDGDHSRADLHIAAASADAPSGDYRDYILNLAEEDPDAFSTSIVFREAGPFIPDPSKKGRKGQPPDDDPFWLPHARIDALHQCDVVDEGAGNNALFGRPDYMAEQAERFLAEHPSILTKALAPFFERKHQKEEEEMSERTLAIAEMELATALNQTKTIETALAAETAKVVEFEGSKDRIHDEAFAEGGSDMVTVLKKRVETCGNAGFVLETALDTEAEFSAKCITALKKGQISKDTDGQDTIEFSELGGDGGDGGGAPAAKTFEALVDDRMEKRSLSRGAATRMIVAEYPKEHEEYKARNVIKRDES